MLVARAGLLVAGCLVLLGVPAHLTAQAGPGPMGPPPGDMQPEASSQPVQPVAKPKPLPPPRASIAGTWKLNTDDSDNARDRIETAEGSGRDNSDPYPNSYPGGGYPGGYPGQYPYPTNRPPQNTGPDLAGNSKIAPLIQPPPSVTIDLVSAPVGGASAGGAVSSADVPKSTGASEVDVTDQDFNKLVLYTDGRRLPKPADASRVEIAAHWNGNKLVSDEKSPLKGDMSRTFELSPDGRQLYETLHIDNGKKKPVEVRFVYDETSSDFQSDSDPNRPVLQRNSDRSGSSQ